MKLVTAMIIILGSIYYFTIKQNIHKNWYSDKKEVNFILNYAITFCSDNEDPNDNTIVSVINNIYKGSSVSNDKDLKVAKCTKKVMKKYDPLLMWNAVMTNDSSTTNAFFKDIREIRNNKSLF